MFDPNQFDKSKFLTTPFHNYIIWFKDIKKEDTNLVGGKGANLGEMVNSSFPIPNGFVVTLKAYFDFIKENNLANKIKHLINLIDLNNQKSLDNASRVIKKEIIEGKLSQTLVKKILSAYGYLGHPINEPFVAVMSSSNFEDLKNVSFAGQQESFLNVRGDANLILKIKEVWASLFNQRAIFYRHENNLSHFRLGIAVVVQKLEKHYRFPQDVEWAIEKNKTYLLQTRPVTTVKSEIRPFDFAQGRNPKSEINTATKVYVNLSDPSLAGKASLLDADGVGLLRAEFMMAQIGIHPKKMIRTGKSNTFISMLSDGLEKFCRAFGERIVVYRTSDLKTNEYQNLVAGRQFEPVESNPMLGYRGALRYISDPEVFDLELAAIKRLRNLRGCKNLCIMIPFVRTIKELISVKKLISNSGLYRSESFKIWMMVEIPSNVILLEKFINVGLDGVSIGSNDLTQLILAIDRDNSEIASEFDEQNESVLWAIEKVIKTCNKYKITSSICGHAASMYPTLLEKLVKWGITSVSVSPDAVGTTRKLISEYEKKIIS